MSARWAGWRRDPLPAEVAAAVSAHQAETSDPSGGGAPGRRRERILAWALDARTGQHVVAGEHHLYVVAAPAAGPGAAAGRAADPAASTSVSGATGRTSGGTSGGSRAAVVLARPWHMVDSGVWERDSSTLRVTWVDRAAPSVFLLLEPNQFPETLRERVQGTVVASEPVDLGQQRSARVVVRRDLARDVLVCQTILGRGVHSTDPGVLAATEAVLSRLREQVGLD